MYLNKKKTLTHIYNKRSKKKGVALILQLLLKLKNILIVIKLTIIFKRYTKVQKRGNKTIAFIASASTFALICISYIVFIILGFLFCFFI
jgi:chromate transport protein ChrA